MEGFGDILHTWIIHQVTTIKFVILAADGVEIKYRTWLSKMPIFRVVITVGHNNKTKQSAAVDGRELWFLLMFHSLILLSR
ncbi:hypothetical protein ACFLWE_00310 [Chloroflexota bacterium]